MNEIPDSIIKRAKTFRELNSAIAQIYNESYDRDKSVPFNLDTVVKRIWEFRTGKGGIDNVIPAYGIKEKVLELAEFYRKQGDWSHLIGEGYEQQRSFAVHKSVKENKSNFPSAGYKLHIAASKESAMEVAYRALYVLRRHNVPHKVVAGLEELEDFYRNPNEYGKFITVYPRNEEEALIISAELDRELAPIAKEAIKIRTDEPVYGSESGRLFHRYGRFERSDDVFIYNPQTGDKWKENQPGQPLPPWKKDIFKERFHKYKKS